MNIHVNNAPEPAAQGRVVTKAVIAATDRLGLNAARTADILGLSAPTISRMKRLDFLLEPGSKPFELAVLLIRVFRSLDAITGGDEAVAKNWLRNHNIALGAAPADMLATITGLIDVLSYLDARRAPV
ncbi:MbcA/ParS/Xre antitoxin family protein [Agrobacterium tumefaciens]|uniref:MbcA/ParS/Xre antitoxin family protein n=1 Tax=Agrobacterium tumefaciens TaxID=358 RepID=UPI00287D4CF8|nr:MbcA/ParS/Xre antitoxin family protein [Agrobacterium tumefaciens]MDS7596439.1 MbcA/ParS/Xre antitoxin family protein [Agrobacterium tumefaciens]